MRGIPGNEIALRARLDGAVREALFRELWTEYWPRLVSFLSALGLGDEDSEDAAQDALIKAFERILDYDPARAFSTWLYAIGRNLARDRIRKSAGRDSVLSGRGNGNRELVDLAPSPFPGPEQSALDAVDAAFARRFIERLDPRDRAIAELFYGADSGCAEIARALGAPTGTVKWRLSEIRRRLAAEWEAGHG